VSDEQAELEKALQRLIDEMPEMVLDAAEPAMKAALAYLHGKLPPYPPKPAPGTASKFWTDKQRRWFWWALRTGAIQGDYKRTGTLGRKITEDTTRDDTGVTGEIGTNTPYAPWVIGPAHPGEIINGVQMYQARIHEGRWWRLYDVVDENREGAFDEFSETFWRELKVRWEQAPQQET
jgi:hypothetical protein